MAVAVYKAIRSNDCLYVKSPTGGGKTIASFFPAVKALGLTEGQQGLPCFWQATQRVKSRNASLLAARMGILSLLNLLPILVN